MAGIDEVTPHIALDGAEDVVAAFREIAQAAQTAFGQIEQAAAHIGGAGDAIKNITEEGKRSFQDMGTVAAEAFAKILDAASSGNFTGLVTKMFGEFAGAITETITKLSEFIDQQAMEMETLANLAQATGMATSEILGLREAFASVGISTNGFERSIGRLAITIANEWSQIQQSVRTSADAQVGAMLSVQQASLNLEKAHHSMNEALTESVQQEQKNAAGVVSAALELRKAGEALSDFAAQSQHNSLSIESAQLALTRAKMNLAKDQGQKVSPEDEKRLKIAGDELQVKEAQLKLQDAERKKQKEGLEMEELQNRAVKASIEAEAAKSKAIEDSIKMSDRLKEARLHEQQAALAVSEAQEKQHQADLKNIPAIAKEIEQVAEGQRKWADMTNRTEISAQNLTKAIILAASAGSSEAPTTMSVFKEMSQLFEKMGTDATASNAKLEIIQHTMGAGFRAGQASAAQIAAVMARGWQETERFMEDMKKFGESINLNRAEEQLKAFNSSFAQLEGAIDIVKKSWSGMMAQMLTPLFDTLRKSIEETDGSMNKIVRGIGAFIDGFAKAAVGIGELVGKIASPAWAAFVEVSSRILTVFGSIGEAIGKVTSTVSELMGMKMDAFWAGFTGIIGGAAIASRGLASALGMILLRLAVIPAAIGLAITAFGGFMRLVGRGIEILPKWLGGGASENTAALIHAGEQVEAYGQKVMRTLAKVAGVADETLDKAGEKREGHEGTNIGRNEMLKGIFGDSKELAKMMEEPAKDQQHAAADQGAAAKTQLEAAQANAKKSEAEKSQSDRNQEFFREKIKQQNPGQSAGHDPSAPEQKEAATEQKQAASEQRQGAAQFNTGVSAFDTAINAMVNGLASILAKIPTGGGGGDGKAGGGMIRGPGTPTSDQAGLFALSDGEYVVRSAAVSHYGPQLFEALNNLAFGGFATGGIVGPRAPSLGGAGASGGPSSVLNLTIDGNHFNGLKAPDAVASKLKSYAVSRQTASAQKMPSWMR